MIKERFRLISRAKMVATSELSVLYFQKVQTIFAFQEQNYGGGVP